MVRGSTAIGLAGVFIVGLAATGSGGSGSAALAQTPAGGRNPHAATLAGDWVKNNPPGRTTAQARPVVKDNMHPRVSPKEREAMGLPAPTWVATDGKVQKAVREAFEEQKKLIERDPHMAWVQPDRPAGFEGTAYVDVYLSHEPKGKPKSEENHAAIKQVQKRILAKLTAAEFSLVFAFENTAGLVGYIDEAGLAKLVSDPTVVAIGLDDQARPEDPPIAMHESGPAVKRREQPASTEMVGKVEAAVYKALEKSDDGYVFVIVPTGATHVERTEAEYQAEAHRIQHGVLSALNAEEFKARCRGGSLYAGYVNGAGLTKLAARPEVVGVGLNMPIRLPERSMDGKHWTP